MDEIFIQIRFAKETEFGIYKDALYYSLEEHKSLTDKDIETAKQERVDNWIYIRQNPDPVPELSKEDLLLRIENLDLEKVELQQILIEDYEPTKEELEKITEKLDYQKDIIQNKIIEIENIDNIEILDIKIQEK